MIPHTAIDDSRKREVIRKLACCDSGIFPSMLVFITFR